MDSFPFTDAVIPPLTGTPKNPITNKEYLNQFSEDKLSACCLPAVLNLNAVVKDPTEVLRTAIKGQNIVHTVVIAISTAAAEGSSGFEYFLRGQ